MTKINYFKFCAFFSSDVMMIGQLRWIARMSKISWGQFIYIVIEDMWKILKKIKIQMRPMLEVGVHIHQLKCLLSKGCRLLTYWRSMTTFENENYYDGCTECQSKKIIYSYFFNWIVQHIIMKDWRRRLGAWMYAN
jgi:hypothetical protein